MMEVVGGEGGHVVLVVDGIADLDQLVERRGHLQPGLVDQVGASRTQDHGARLPGEGEGLALGVLHCRLRAAGEILGFPLGRRILPVLGEGVEIGEPAGADPASRVDEGAIADVHRRALGREFQVGALVVDREGLHVEIDLDAGLLLELREVALEVFEVGRLEARAVDGGAGIGLAALRADIRSGQRNQRRSQCTAENRATTKNAHVLPPGSCRRAVFGLAPCCVRYTVK